MHVLHVETGRHLYGGPQQVVYILGGLQARGVESTLVCPPGSGIAAAAKALPVRTIEVPARGDLDPGLYRRLRRVIRDCRPDLVHCHSRRGADFYGGRAAAAEKVPALVSRRVDNVESAFVARLRYRPFRHVIAISEAIATVLRAAGVDNAKLSVIRSAVDCDAFAAAADRGRLKSLFGIGREHVAIACAGQLIERKGQRFLLESMAALKHRIPMLRAVIFGKGREEQRLRDQCAALDLDGVVTFAGFHDDLDRFLGAFDMLVHPALTEGLGVIALKAQAAGLPVIAFRAGGLVEVVVDGETGRLTPSADVSALTAAIAELATDAALRERYSRNATVHANKSFSVETMVDAHIRLYENLLAEPGH